MNEYLVSVITPAYNCGKTVAETIESVQAQTWTNWEMIIVDDCSRDNTAEVVRSYAEADDRIRYVCLESNQGSAAARNKAISLAKGDYIALLDSDDLWKPNKLERQIPYMAENGYALTYTSYDVFTDPGAKRRKLYPAVAEVDYKCYLRNTIIGCLTVVVDAAQIPDFHMEKGYLEDVLTWMYYLRQGFVAYGLQENLASYRIVPGSKSNNKWENAKRYYGCLKAQPGLNGIQRIWNQMGYVYHALKKRFFGAYVTL